MSLMVWAALAAVGCSSDEADGVAQAPLGQVLLDGGPAVSPGADGGAPLQTAVSGTAAAAGCYSYSRAEPDSAQCNGYFCGATEAQIAQSLPAQAVCPLNPADICKGTLTDAVATCTRSVVIQHLGEPVEPLRPQIQECIYANADLKARIPETCLGCYLNVAVCAAGNCLVECLSDNPNCDSCRRRNNCDAPVFACAGLPSPL